MVFCGAFHQRPTCQRSKLVQVAHCLWGTAGQATFMSSRLSWRHLGSGPLLHFLRMRTTRPAMYDPSLGEGSLSHRIVATFVPLPYPSLHL